MHPTLKQCIDDFLQYCNSYDATEGDYSFHYNKVLGFMANFNEIIILQEELNGIGRENILIELAEIRQLIRQSPFLRKIQDWPRGYQGDFETIEYLCNGTNTTPSDSAVYYFEEFALRGHIVEQHKNKVYHQSDLIKNTICSNEGNTKILSIGSGGNIDVSLCLPQIKNKDFTLVLNDMDNDAIEFSKKRLHEISEKCHFINENIIKATEVAKFAPYDLVITGGVFDYLKDKAIILLLKNFKNSLLHKGGKFFFTNIKSPNQFRIAIEYFANWYLIERSREDVIRLCITAGFSEENINIQEDKTGFTYLVEVTND
jgi:extracellular factor (EF) 3-hydroxypalmitic acid methyl ester biosynthesis protein